MIPVQDNIPIQELTPKHQKVIAIADSIINTATLITESAKQLPKTGKRRNIFIKSYNRRPLNKRKRNTALVSMMLKAHAGAVQIAIIQSQPIPKYKK